MSDIFLRQIAGVFALSAFVSLPRLTVAADRPIDGISDNSFLLEEAYNQEEGVVQHIFSAYYSADSRTRGWTFNFTQEWPVFSQSHQFSFTIPSYHARDEGERVSGVGDVLLNYRYQALDEETDGIAVVPRFSLILPTGSRRRGTGNGVVGYQSDIAFSNKVSDRMAMHVNLGLTYEPKVRVPVDLPGNALSPTKSLLGYTLGASAIYAVVSRFHLMLEWQGISEQSIDNTGNRSRAFISILSPGVRGAVINEKDFQSVIGFAVPIGLNRNADTFGAFLYLSIEHKLF
jgi:hypothetical protein